MIPNEVFRDTLIPFLEYTAWHTMTQVSRNMHANCLASQKYFIIRISYQSYLREKANKNRNLPFLINYIYRSPGQRRGPTYTITRCNLPETAIGITSSLNEEQLFNLGPAIARWRYLNLFRTGRSLDYSRFGRIEMLIYGSSPNCTEEIDLSQFIKLRELQWKSHQIPQIIPATIQTLRWSSSGTLDFANYLGLNLKSITVDRGSLRGLIPDFTGAAVQQIEIKSAQTFGIIVPRVFKKLRFARFDGIYLDLDEYYRLPQLEYIEVSNCKIKGIYANYSGKMGLRFYPKFILE